MWEYQLRSQKKQSVEKVKPGRGISTQHPVQLMPGMPLANIGNGSMPQFVVQYAKGKLPKVESGAQENIQKLIAGIYREYRGAFAQEEWAADLEGNGLCVGWSMMHRENPEQFVKIWQALEQWDQEEDIAAYMRRKLNYEPSSGWEEYIVLFADRAVEIMKEIESGEYQTLSDLGGGERAPLRDFSGEFPNADKTRMMDVRDTDAGNDVYKAILSDSILKNRKGEGNKMYIVHIITSRHHMSMRIRCLKRENRIEEIVETEYVGVVSRPDKARAVQILDHGIYLPQENEENKAQRIQILFYKKSDRAEDENEVFE